MRAWRKSTAVVTGLALGVGLALGGATSATAAPAGHWGSFTLSGTNRDYSGTMTMPGFPATTFRSDSRQTDVVSGATTYQPVSTGPGARYGSSKGQPYLGQRPLVDAPNRASASITTYTFAEPTPAGSWSLVLGDIDADQATVTATLPSGAAATAADLGFAGAYNSCSVSSPGGRSCPADPDGTVGRDRPTWDAATSTLVGNPSAADTAGATGWFTPTVPLASLTVTFQQRSGFPVYQTWFASRTAAIAGVVTLDGTPVAGVPVTATAPNGVETTTTTAADGTYTFPFLPVGARWTVAVEAPAGADGASTAAVDLATTTPGADGRADFAFTAPAGTTSVVGTVSGPGGRPAADVPVVVSDAADPTAPPLVETTTNEDGVYAASGLPASGAVLVSVGGGAPVRVVTGNPGTVARPPVIPAADAVGVLGGRVQLGTAAAPGVEVELLDAAGEVVLTTTTNADGRYTFTVVPGVYTVRSALPRPDAEGTPTTSATVVGGTTVEAPLIRFTAPVPAVPTTTSATGRVFDDLGRPVAVTVVTATPQGEGILVPVTATTADDGSYSLPGLVPGTTYVVTVPGGRAPQRFTAGATAADVVTVAALVVPAAVPEPTPTPTQTPAPAPSAVPAASDGGSGTGPSGTTAGALAYTGADITPGLLVAGVLAAAGAGILVSRSARGCRAARRRG